MVINSRLIPFCRLFPIGLVALMTWLASMPCANALPASRPDIFSIVLNQRPSEPTLQSSSVEILISPYRSHLLRRTTYKSGTIHEKKIAFYVGPRDLDRLYAVLLSNSFDKIGTKHKAVPGRSGGASLTVETDGEVIEKSNMDETTVKWSSLSKFNRIVKAIQAIVSKQTNGMQL